MKSRRAKLSGMACLIAMLMLALWWRLGQREQTASTTVSVTAAPAVRQTPPRSITQTNFPSPVASGTSPTVVAANPVPPNQDGQLGENTLRQIEALQREKENRTAAQRKLDSQLIYAGKTARGQPIAAEAPLLQPDVKILLGGMVMVDIDATVSDGLLAQISQGGGQVISSFPKYNAVRATLPLGFVETLAARSDVRSIRRADEGTTNVGSVTSQGDAAHRADTARSVFGVDGTGVKVGVMSDSVTYLSNSQGSGDLGPVTVLAGQSGTGAGEGTAMLEIVHDLAPGAQLFYATAGNSVASFAQNIRDLRAAGCDIIIDDYTYFIESPFQDAPIARAVNDVCASGALYFSSARNSGNKNDGTSGTWEGDFVDGGATSGISRAGRLHSFGTATYNVVANGGSQRRVDLFWADPLGASLNDYDLYVADSVGNIVRSSTTTQAGVGDPYESIGTLNVGERIIIVKFSGVGRFLHLDTGRAVLNTSTPGSVRGHNGSGASNAFSVAATRASTPAAPFTGGPINPVETFSSDGPRRMFFDPDGIPLTPGNFSTTGGVVLQKPDITAADGVATSVPGFSFFTGTSAAAPHAGAIAALIKSYNPTMKPVEIRAALMNSAIDIEGPGFDRDSGAGVIMALGALQAAPLRNLARVQTNSVVVLAESFAPTNSAVDPGETVTVNLLLKNIGDTITTNLTATLLATNGVLSPSGPQNYGALATNGTPVGRPFTFTANGPPGSMISALLKLQDGDLDMGTVSFDILLGKVTYTTNTFTQSVSNSIPSLGSANPYPSTIVISNLVNPVTKVTARLSGLTHARPDDLDILLVGPTGAKSLLMSDAGGSVAISNVTLTFDDAAANSLPDATQLTSGTYKPSNYGTGDTPAAPAPAGPYAAWMSTFIGLNPNGTWSLFITDDQSGSTGNLGGGWRLDVVTVATNYSLGPGTLDLALGVTTSLTNAIRGTNLTYTLTVTNRGPATATGVTLTNVLPNADLVSVTASLGTYTQNAGVLVFSLDTLATNAGATITIVVSPTQLGLLTNAASLGVNEVDYNLANNARVIVTPVELPALSINDVFITEGDTGTTNAVFTVTLSAPTTDQVTVNYVTAGGTATADIDFSTTSGTLTFAPGETSATITVPVIGDLIDEADETFFVNLTAPVAASIAKSQGIGTILDNDPLPSLSISDVSVMEGNTGTTNAIFNVTLSAVSGKTVTVIYLTANGTATSGSDYNATSGTLSFLPGETNKTISVSVIGDTTPEADETYSVILSNPINVALAKSVGAGTIVNDDPFPVVTIANASVAEGNTGTVSLTFNLTISPPSSQTVSFRYATADGTASAGNDYQSKSGLFVLAAGTTATNLSITIYGDTLVEGDETFFVNLSSPTNIILGNTQAVGTILNDDGLPGQIDHFEWNPVSSPQLVNRPFAVNVTAKDYFNATATGFTGAARLSLLTPDATGATIAITEIDPGTPDAVELMNVSNGAVDASGWQVTFYDTNSYPGPKITFAIPTGTVVPPGGIFRVTDQTNFPGVYPEFNTGTNINWSALTNAPAAVLLRNASGTIVDFACVGPAVSTAISNPVAIPTNFWLGAAIAATSNTNVTYQRRGSTNHHTNADWQTNAPTAGLINAGLTIPFTDAQPPVLVAPTNLVNFVNGTWTGNIAVQGLGTNFVLRTDDGNGHSGSSGPLNVVANTAPSLTMPPSQVIDEMTTLTVTIIATDTDVPADTLAFALVSAPSGVSLDSATGVLTWTPTEAQGPSTNVIVVKVTDSGVQNLSATNSFVVVVNEVTVPPGLAWTTPEDIVFGTPLGAAQLNATANVPGTFIYTPTSNTVVTAGNARVLSVTFIPDDTDAYAIATTNVTINVAKASQTINFATLNDRTYGNTPFAVTATASSDLPVLLAIASGPATIAGSLITLTNSGTVVVHASQAGNTNFNAAEDVERSFTVHPAPPRLTMPPDQFIDELTALSVTITATDINVPSSPLTFALVSSPQGVNLHPTSGALTWTPTEAQGPSTNLIVVKVTCDNAPELSATNSFTVVVREVNTAPLLLPVADKIINQGSLLTVQSVVFDFDLPANVLTFALLSAPTGMTIGTNGLISWTAAPDQAPSTNLVIFKVTDDGVPNLSATNTFTVFVRLTNTPPQLAALPAPIGDDFRIDFVGEAGRVYVIEVSSDLLQWIPLMTITNVDGRIPVVDTNALRDLNHRFYRVIRAP